VCAEAFSIVYVYVNWWKFDISVPMSSFSVNPNCIDLIAGVHLLKTIFLTVNCLLPKTTYAHLNSDFVSSYKEIIPIDRCGASCMLCKLQIAVLSCSCKIMCTGQLPFVVVE